ncbi:alpha/beta fold hydrolase [bacterium]|nr:alpha/beta fold hydrolase [bacterium]
MPSSTKPVFIFPVGYQDFHKDQLFNFQLNRPYSLAYARLEDQVAAGTRIRNFGDWKSEMLRQAERAKEEGRLMNAAFHYRSAEFYTFPHDPDKIPFYDAFLELFEAAFHELDYERVLIPYSGGALPAMVMGEAGGRGDILLHGGYDSFIEEFVSLQHFFASKGYRVIAFEGPGQGAARRRHGLTLDYRWEKPVAAVLDHFDSKDATLIGLSLGGYFALRAASFESRLKRVIAYGHAYDYSKVSSALAMGIMKFFRNHLEGFTNWLSMRKISQEGMEAWNISHLLFVLDEKRPMKALDLALEMNEANLRSDQVRQDVLLLPSKEDHFIPFRLHEQQLRRLTSARSVTEHVFTREENAQNHCHIGNIGLSLQVMSDWMDGLD